jgi:hypothetical protein
MFLESLTLRPRPRALAAASPVLTRSRIDPRLGRRVGLHGHRRVQFLAQTDPHRRAELLPDLLAGTPDANLLRASPPAITAATTAMEVAKIAARATAIVAS